jgi:hypothetical protein
MISAEIIMLAIRAGIKLGGVAKQAYVATTRQGELTIPLPDSFYQVDLANVENFFKEGYQGHKYLIEGTRLADLYSRQFPGNKLNKEEERDLIAICAEYMAQEKAIEEKSKKVVHLAGNNVIDIESWSAVLTVRQFSRGEVEKQNRRLLHNLLGTIVEVGVDYFASIPGGLNTESSHGKILKAFVEALDKIPFADLDYQRDWLNDVGKRFLIAALDTVSAHPELVSRDPNIERLVKVTTYALTNDVRERLESAAIKGSLAKQNNLKDWAELVFTSILSNAGREVVNGPARYLGIDDEGEAALITRVGGAFLDLAVEKDDLTLYRVIGKDGLDRMMKAALGAVSEYPSLLGMNEKHPLSSLVKDLAETLSAYKDPLRLELLPELMRLILSKGEAHLDVIWKAYVNDPTKPENHLLLTASKKAIAILIQKQDGAKWKPGFTQKDVLSVVETVLDEISGNPNWLLMKASEVDKTLEAALKSTLDVLRERGDERLGQAAAASILKSAFMASAMRLDFVENTKIKGIEKPFVSAVADTILSLVFVGKPDKAQWQLMRTETLVTLFDISFHALARRTDLDEPAVGLLNGVIQTRILKMVNGETLDLEEFQKELQAALLKKS